MELIKGAPVSEKIKEEVGAMLEKINGPAPKLAIIRVGENPDDMSYERGAVKKMDAFGLRSQCYTFPADITDEDFKKEFTAINADTDVSGILLLRPLPKQICEKDIEAMIDPKKDLDGISPVNIAKVFSGDPTGFAPCTPEAVIEVLKSYNSPMEGKRAVIVGSSMVVGRPLSMLIFTENATVTICQPPTKDLPGTCQQAEILVAAAGKAKMLDDSYVGENTTVIDVGINVDENGKLCGDAAADTLEGKSGKLTPVPGGVGAVTTAVLAKNLVQAALRK